MKRLLCLALIALLFIFPAAILAKENPENIPDSLEAKAALDSMFSALEHGNLEAFSNFLPDSGDIKSGMNGGMLEFYMSKANLIKLIGRGNSILSRHTKLDDLRGKLEKSEKKWEIQSSYIRLEIVGDRDWVFSLKKDMGRYYLIEFLDPNDGFGDRLLEELKKKDQDKDTKPKG